MSISKLSVYDLERHSTIEQLHELINKMNEIVNTVNIFEKNQICVEFDSETGNLKILPQYLMDEENVEDNEYWKGKY